MNLLNWFVEEENGQGMVEYGLIIALISIVVIVILTNIGTNLKNIFTQIEKALKTGTGTGTGG